MTIIACVLEPDLSRARLQSRRIDVGERFGSANLFGKKHPRTAHRILFQERMESRHVDRWMAGWIVANAGSTGDVCAERKADISLNIDGGRRALG